MLCYHSYLFYIASVCCLLVVVCFVLEVSKAKAAVQFVLKIPSGPTGPSFDGAASPRTTYPGCVSSAAATKSI